MIRRTLLLRHVLDDAAVRGWARVLEDAGVDPQASVQVCSALKRIWNQARSGVAAIGDARRAAGQAVPLCGIPGDPDKAGSPGASPSP
jgi:hypothetical protein